jgi:uncharacterized coiled-coil DUF342 family protein
LAVEREQLCEQVDELVTARNALTSERDVLAAQLDQLSADARARERERDALTSDRDGLASQLAAVLSERDALVVSRDAMTSARDGLVTQRDQLAAERLSIKEHVKQVHACVCVCVYHISQRDELAAAGRRSIKEHAKHTPHPFCIYKERKLRETHTTDKEKGWCGQSALNNHSARDAPPPLRAGYLVAWRLLSLRVMFLYEGSTL